MAALSIREQDRLIRAAWPGLRTIIAGKRLGIWRGAIQGLSRAYEVEVIYARNRRGDPFRYSYAPFPEVTVLDPPISRRADDPDDPIPHVYNDPDRDQPILCLFDPRTDGWNRSQAIADTILVWAAGWLRFYEAWQATGIWTGGSAPHGPMMRPAPATMDEERPSVTAPQTRHLRRELLCTVAADALLAGLGDHEGASMRPDHGDQLPSGDHYFAVAA